MKNSLRVTVFGSFAAIGVGVAICIGTSPAPPPDAGISQSAKLAVRVVSEGEPSAPSLRQPEPSPVASRAHDAVATAPRGPVWAQPAPLQGQQFTTDADNARLQETYEYLRRQLEGDAAPAGAAPAGLSRPPLPMPPAAPGVAAPPSNAQTPAAAGAAPAKNDAAAPKATIDAEGDGKLTIHIQNCEIREVLDLLGEQGNMNILAGSKVQGKISATLAGVDINSALDAILKSAGLSSRREGKFIFVGTPEDFTSIEQAGDRVGTRVYRPNYVPAADLQKLIQPMLTPSTGVVSVSTPAEKGIPADQTTVGGNSFAGGDALMVRDYEAVLTAVDQIVAEVDVRPMQVHIEAMILSIHLKDSDRYGVNFQLLRDKKNIKFALGAPETTLANVKFEQGALKFGFLDTSLGAFLDALETIGDTNVIATPRLMVLNKHRAEIQIGEQKGYVNTTVTETSSTQSVQFLDVGALLRLRPFISTDGLIRMEIHPELSDGSVKTENGFTLPEKRVTQVTTNIMIGDGCTVVIGGLMQENLVTSIAQVPLLGNLPLVGFCFRSSSETTERHEVIVLITPHIVYEPATCQEGDKEACEFHRRQAVFADKMTPFNKRSMGRRYFRLAQSAWAGGERDKALRFAEMSVHFDPLNRAAIELRSDIWQGKHGGEHSLDYGESPAPVNPLDTPEMAEWLLNDLEHQPLLTPVPEHPLDPGQPGRRLDIISPRKLQ